MESKAMQDGRGGDKREQGESDTGKDTKFIKQREAKRAPGEQRGVRKVRKIDCMSEYL